MHSRSTTTAGVLESPEDFDSSDDVYDAVGGVILEASGHSADEDGERKVRELCERMFASLKG